MWGEEVRVGWQVTLISLTLKYGLWEGTWYKDAEQSTGVLSKLS